MEDTLIPSTKTSFFKNVLTLLSGTSFAQLLLLITTPILSRMYSPSDFGIYATFFAITNIIVIISCLSYEYSIVLPKENKDAANLFVLSSALVFVTTILTCSIVITVYFLNGWGFIKYFTWYWLIPLSVLSLGLYQVFNYWSTRNHQFKRISVSRISQVVMMVIFQVLFGFLGSFHGVGLMVGQVIGQFFSILVFGFQVWRDDRLQFKQVDLQGMRKQAKRYIDFLKYYSLSNLFNVVSQQLPVLMLGYFFSPVIVGYYSLAQRLLTAPMNLIGMSIAQVFFPKATQAKKDGTLDAVTINIFKILLLIGVTPMLLFMMISPEAFTFAFGKSWMTSGVYVQLIILWLIFNFISSPISQLYSVLEKQKLVLVINILSVIARGIGLGIGGLLKDPFVAVLVFGIIGFLINSSQCFLLLKLAGIRRITTFKLISKELFIALPFILTVLVCKYLLWESQLTVISIFVVILGLYFISRLRKLTGLAITN